jgi:membrane protease YdiL (CAAX protease family)
VNTLLSSNNRLFVLARQGSRQPSALVAVAITFVTLLVTIIGGQMLGRIAIRSIFPDGASITSPLIQGARDLVGFTTGFLPIYVCLWAWLTFWSKRPFTTLGFENNRRFSRLLCGALVAMVMMSIVAIVLAMLPNTALARGQLLTVGPMAIVGGLLVLLGTFVQSSGEEVLFRGWLLPTTGSRYGRKSSPHPDAAASGTHA